MRTPSTKRQELIQGLLENMSMAKRAMHSYLQSSDWTIPVSGAQLELLVTIQHLQPVSFKDLAFRLRLTPGAVSQLAEGLEQQHLISRTSNEQDRRIQCLSIEPSGEKLIKDAEAHRRRLMERIMEDLTDEELQVWHRVQEKIIQHFQSDTTNQTK